MDTDAVLELLKDVAAEVITPRFRALAHGEVMEKRPGDLVTVADHEAEEIITTALRRSNPQALVVGEEAASTDPSLLSRLPDADHAYTVDPVDGTKNFVHGSANHAVMVAELRHGVSVRAWIWQPEHGRAYVAERGGGCYVNGRRLERAHPPGDLARLRVLTSRPTWEGRRGRLALDSSAWCCGVDYPWLAEGEADALVYSRSLPWDHAPGSLLVEEVGGTLAHLDGTPFRPSQVGTSGLLAAASPDVWRVVATELGPLHA